jgi:hypothetical protein
MVYDAATDSAWFALPLRLFAAAQLCLGGRPPSTAVLAGEHDPVPGLDDVAERAQVPGRTRRVQSLVQLLLKLVAVGVGQGRTDQLDPLRQVWAGCPLGHAHARLLTHRDQSVTV